MAGLIALSLSPWMCVAQEAAVGSTSCIEVEVDGQRAPPSFDCLTHQLAPKAQAGASAGTAPPLASEAIVLRPSNQLGLFNRAATGHRMGDQFGRSAFPQRPPGAAGARPPIPAVPRP